MLETVALKVTKSLVKKAVPAVTEMAKKRLAPTTNKAETNAAYFAMIGLAAGVAGVAAMTVAQKIEQAVTGRANSFVPGHTLARMLGQKERPDNERVAHNLAMQWGLGTLVGGVRGLMASRGVNGPMAGLMLWGFRIALDQTLENASGVGAPPWTWPKDEQVMDAVHKGVFTLTTHAIVEAVAKKLNAA